MEWDFRLADISYYTWNKQQGHIYMQGNYIVNILCQTANEKECEKGDVHIHMKPSHFVIH